MFGLTSGHKRTRFVAVACLVPTHRRLLGVTRYVFKLSGLLQSIFWS